MVLSILGPPEFLNFLLKAMDERFIAREVYLLRLSHKMSMVVFMTIVITKHTPVIDAANAWVDISETVLDHSIFFVPNFFFKNSAPPFAG